MTNSADINTDSKEATAGLLLGLLAFGIWALFPLYWHELDHVDPLQVLAHRAIWTVPVCALVLFYRRELLRTFTVLKDLKTVALLVLSTALISTNWGTYIWSVSNDQILQASMGYYLNPLVNVLAGLTVFGEKLRKGQWLAVALAAAGVLYAALAFDSIPWIGLILAFSFGSYGAVRKLVSVEAVPGLFVETLLTLPVALGYLLWLESQGLGVFLELGVKTDAFLIGGGIVTAIPLLCYVGAARRLPISTVGMLFYLTPTGLFLMAAFLYGEPVGQGDLITFGFIWAALIVFTLERRHHARRRRVTAI